MASCDDDFGLLGGDAHQPATPSPHTAQQPAPPSLPQQVSEICSLLLTLVYPAPPGQPVSMSPAVAASMLLGASVVLMLCGSVTFDLGLLLMPWVAGLALLFGFAGAVNTLSSAVPCNHPRGTNSGPPAPVIGSDAPVA